MGAAGAVPLFVLLAVPRDFFDESGIGLNYNAEPVDWPGWLRTGSGLAAGATFVVALLVLLSPAGRRAAVGTDVRAALAFAGAGLYVALGYRVATAAVSGANIGGGLMFILGCGVVPALIGYAIVQVVSGRRRDWRRQP